MLEVMSRGSGFVIEANSDLSTLFLTSPINGVFKYYYDTVQKRFYSNKDGHLFDENLTREAQKYFGDIL